MRPGAFIVFEGPDCIGKTTQVQKVAEELKKLSIPVVVTQDPGGTEIGDRLMEVLKSYNNKVGHATELLIQQASRAQLVHEIIKPALESDKVVLCDRFWQSTRVYQGYQRGWPQNMLNFLHFITCTSPLDIDKDIVDLYFNPDLLFIFEGESFKSSSKKNRLNKQTLKNRKIITDGYNKIVKQESEITYIVNANDNINTITEYIFKVIMLELALVII